MKISKEKLINALRTTLCAELDSLSDKISLANTFSEVTTFEKIYDMRDELGSIKESLDGLIVAKLIDIKEGKVVETIDQEFEINSLKALQAGALIDVSVECL
jgi:hypothetical protein